MDLLMITQIKKLIKKIGAECRYYLKNLFENLSSINSRFCYYIKEKIFNEIERDNVNDVWYNYSKKKDI